MTIITENTIPSQGPEASKRITIETGLEVNSNKTQQIPKISTSTSKSKMYSLINSNQLRENKIKDFYEIPEGKNAESSRNYTKKVNLLNNEPDETFMQNGASRKSKSKDNYSKNKTFEFPQNYLQSMINSNVDFLVEETPKPSKTERSTVDNTRRHNRSSSKKTKRTIKLNDAK